MAKSVAGSRFFHPMTSENQLATGLIALGLGILFLSASQGKAIGAGALSPPEVLVTEVVQHDESLTLEWVGSWMIGKQLPSLDGIHTIRTGGLRNGC